MSRSRRSPKADRSGELLVVAGRRPVLEAVRAGLATSVAISRTARSTPGLEELMEATSAAGVEVETVADAEVATRAAGQRHQGVVATARLPETLSEADLARRAWSDRALVLVLDGVSDPRNLGACARTAEAAGASALVSRRVRAAALSGVAVRTSAGALLHLPVALVANVARAIGRLREAGFWVVGLDEGGEGSIFGSPAPPGRLALVVGAEGEGLSRLVRTSCDELVAIPLQGRVASLNVSVAAGVALFRYASRVPFDRP